MPSLNREFLNKLKGYDNQYPIFIETGTFQGNTTFSMEPHFDKVYTIELKEAFYNSVKTKYKGSKINFLLGDSSLVLADLLPTINKSVIFFLDGHWSSGDTARGSKDCPLLEELTLINNVFTEAAIIIVDDCRLFEKGPLKGNYNEDWSEISEMNLLSCINERLTDMYYLDSDQAKNDRMILHIRAKN